MDHLQLYTAIARSMTACGMGSSASKAVRTTSSAARKYPSRIPPQTQNTRPTNAQAIRSNEGYRQPTVNHENTTSPRQNSIDHEADLAFGARVSKLGVVQLSPTMSNSSTFNPIPQSESSGSYHSTSASSQVIFPSAASNPAVSLLTARARIMQEAEEEFENLGRKGAPGRRFLNVVTIRQILMMRDELRVPEREIEMKLGLKNGIVKKLGGKGVLSGAGS